MATVDDNENHEVRSRTAVFQIGIEDQQPSSTEQERTASVMRSVSPILNSMRLLGLYFTSKPRVPPETTEHRVARGCQNRWNRERIYATTMFLVAWFNSLRLFALLDGTETLGADLFLKLGAISTFLVAAVLHTAYYIASYTGSLDRVLRQVDLPQEGYSRKYTCMAKVMTVACWILVVWNICNYIYLEFFKKHNTDITIFPLVENFRLSDTEVHILKVVYTLLQTQLVATWTFTQAMKYTILSLKYINVYFHFVAFQS